MSVTSQQPKKIVQHAKPKEAQDVYSVFEDSLERYFKEVKANAASYLQAVSDLQENIIELRKNNADSAISLQKAAYEKLDSNINVPSATLDMAKTIAEQTTKSWNLQNQMMLASLDTLSKNIQAFNTNAKTFEEINKKIIDSWASIIKQTAKD